jgi:tetratricopeptide (TPR) repeat protein
VGDKKYKAFISYSHADEAWGGWLQRSLERFRAPGSLAAPLQADGKSTRLAPVFRDREDLPVAGNLNAAIQAALADSDFQIVLCSPNAAKSRWVNEEIKLFHKLHGPGRVFALIVDGEPNATQIPGREDEECFPPALRFLLDAEGDLTDAPAETLAADARKGRDGRRYALLKVAAGMLGVGLDDLVRRDASRRARQAWTVAGASVAGMAATIALSLFAVAKSNEATLMRGKAENLIEFMLTDLKDKLEPVGRLDILKSVVDRAMAYYADQDLKSLDDDALARRAKAMTQLGTIDFRLNDFDAAAAAYAASEQATGELLRRAPNDPDRIFDHAQNVFYVGEVAFRRYDKVKSEAQNLEYLRLAQRLVDIDGDNPRSHLELAYATSNIGTVKFEAGRYAEAIPYFEKSIAARKDLVNADPDNPKFRIAYAYAMSWLGYAELERGNFRGAIAVFREQLAAYDPLWKENPDNYTALDAVVTAQRRMADAYLLLGEVDEAAAVNEAAEKTADRLIMRDARNANWSINAAHIERAKSINIAASGAMAGAAKAADRSVDLVAAILTDDAPQWYFSALGQSLAWRLDLLGARADASDAERLETLIAGAIAKDARDNARFIGAASLSLAAYEGRKGRAESARAIVTRAIESLEPFNARISAAAKIYLAALYLDAGAGQKAAAIIAELDGLQTNHPDFLAVKQRYLQIAQR